MIKLFKNNPLYFSFILPMLNDGVMTLVGQNQTYWLNYKTANEMSPAYFFMVAHPLLFILGSITWFIGLYWIFLRLKHPYNLILACAFIAGNTWGSTSWITKMMKDSGFFINRFSILSSWVILVLYFIVIGIFAGLSISQYIKDNSHRGK